jgi:hypothetical protein
LGKKGTSPEEIRQEYLHVEGRRLADKQWWTSLERSLEKLGVPEEDRKYAQQLSHVHDFNLTIEDQPSDQSVTIYECGPDVEEALTTIDQLGSGLHLRSQAARTLVFLEGVPMITSFRKREAGGLSTKSLTAINISYARRLAAEYNVGFDALLSNILAHEILGHQVERIVEGNTKQYFNKHFDYSEGTRPTNFMVRSTIP